MPKTDIVEFPSLLPPLHLSVSYGRYGLTVWSGGFVRFDAASPTNHRHQHESHHELCLVLAGSGTFKHGHESFDLSSGSLFFSEKKVPHEITVSKGRELYLVFVSIAITETSAPISPDAFDAVIHRFLLGHSLLANRCDDLVAYLRVVCIPGTTRFDQARREEAAKLLVLDALDRFAIQKSSIAADGSHVQRGIAGKAIAFLEGVAMRPVAVGEIAAVCGCSDRHVRRVFRKETGKSILDSVNEKRMNLAAQQLLMRFSVTQVANLLQMSSVAHFSRMFKRYHSRTPKEYQTINSPRTVLPKTTFNTRHAAPVSIKASTKETPSFSRARK